MSKLLESEDTALEVIIDRDSMYFAVMFIVSKTSENKCRES